MYLRYFLHKNKITITITHVLTEICAVLKVGFITSTRGYLLGAFADCEKRLLASCLSVRMQQLCSHWTDFHGILYLGIFRKCVEKILSSSKSVMNNGYFTWRPMHIYDNIWIILRMKNISDKRCRGNQNTQFIFNNFFPPKIVTFMR